jgi:ATP-dependent RNA helicase DDX19/DBP5
MSEDGSNKPPIELKSLRAGLEEVEEEKEVQVTLAVGDQALYQSASTFEDLKLRDDILKGIYGMGFQRPSKIQATALPLLLADPPGNLIGQSQSGTGKTAAFVLAMLSRIDMSKDQVQALCLAPSRELARQIMDNVREMGKYTKVTTSFAIPDSVGPREIINAHIVVGTPGTVQNFIKKRQIDCQGIKIFVLDEADNMLDQQGLGESSIRIKK